MQMTTEFSDQSNACASSQPSSEKSLSRRTRPRLLPLLIAACALSGTVAFAQTGGTDNVPADPATPPAPSVVTTDFGGVVMLNVQGAASDATFQWSYNGEVLKGETNFMLVLPQMTSALTGVYSVAITTPGTTTAQVVPTVVGLSTRAKFAGDVREVQGDIVHANGNVYDQMLLTGPSATITADAGQTTRVSYVDLDDDIVQVEFSGAGSLTISLDNYSPAAAPVKYNQAGIEYVRGHARIVIANANETTHVAVFSVGRTTAVNQALFRSDVDYDGVADIASIAIQSSNGKFGGVYTGNASYLAAKGLTGVFAPTVQFTAPVNVGEITASEVARPVLQLGASTSVHITGGDLFQVNDAPVEVSGFTQLGLTAGATSQGGALPAQSIKGRLMQNGVDVTQMATTL